MTAGLRERKKVALRQSMHLAALHLVAERGLESVSVDDIVDRAEVSQRTFFNYFASKEDAILGVDPSSSGSLAVAFAARPSHESALLALRTVLRERAAQMAEDTDLWRLRMQVVDAHPLLAARLGSAFGETERVLAEAIGERTGTRPDVDVYPTLLAAVQSAVMRTSLHRWLAAGFRTSLPELVDQAWDVLAAGLPAPRTI